MCAGGCTVTTKPETLVFCDAGPLIHLDELGQLDLLADFHHVLVTDTVWREVLRHRQVEFAGLPVERLPDPPLTPILGSLGKALALDAGEISALALTDRYPEALFLTDDTAARLAATQMKVRVHGTLGILLRAVRRRQRSREEISEVLRTLPERSTLYIRRDLLDWARREVEKYAE